MSVSLLAYEVQSDATFPRQCYPLISKCKHQYYEKKVNQVSFPDPSPFRATALLLALYVEAAV